MRLRVTVQSVAQGLVRDLVFIRVPSRPFAVQLNSHVWGGAANAARNENGGIRRPRHRQRNSSTRRARLRLKFCWIRRVTCCSRNAVLRWFELITFADGPPCGRSLIVESERNAMSRGRLFAKSPWRATTQPETI